MNKNYLNKNFCRRDFLKALGISGTALSIFCCASTGEKFVAQSLQLEPAKDVLSRHGYSYWEIFKDKQSFKRIVNERAKGIFHEIKLVMKELRRESSEKLKWMKKLGRELAKLVNDTPKNKRKSEYVIKRDKFKNQIKALGAERKELDRKLVALNDLTRP